MKSITATIDWFGPYSIEEAAKASKFDYEDGVYMVIGKAKYERSDKLQYIGLATDLGKRLNGNHHKIPQVTRDQKIWLGEVTSPRTPGKKIKVTDRLLDLAEWAHAYFLQLPLNGKKTTNPPDREIVVYNRWWQKDYETQYKQRPHRNWPDFIDYYGPNYLAKIVWFGARQKVALPHEFRS